MPCTGDVKEKGNQVHGLLEDIERHGDRFYLFIVFFFQKALFELFRTAAKGGRSRLIRKDTRPGEVKHGTTIAGFDATVYLLLVLVQLLFLDHCTQHQPSLDGTADPTGASWHQLTDWVY